MRFEDNLYSAMCDAFPKITVRSFSEVLGKSSGYWSSITSQRLPVSNTALIHLSDFLELNKMLLNEHDNKLHKLNAIQRSIAQEIVERFAIENESFDAVWDEVSTKLRNELVSESELYGAMPFAYSAY